LRNNKLPHHIRRKLVKLPRKKYHPITYHLRKSYGISKGTIFYMKEYGPDANIIHTIIKESIKILILASVISLIGGFGLQAIQDKIYVIIPLIIMLPALNDMIGDYGTIVSSKFTTALYLGKIKSERWWTSRELHRLFHIIMSIAVISAIYIGALSYGIAYLKGFAFDYALFVKIIQISLVSVIVLVSLIFIISILIGLHIYKKNEDPNNFLIPITTSIADLGSLLIFSGLVFLFFGVISG